MSRLPGRDMMNPPITDLTGTSDKVGFGNVVIEVVVVNRHLLP